MIAERVKAFGLLSYYSRTREYEHNGKQTRQLRIMKHEKGCIMSPARLKRIRGSEKEQLCKKYVGSGQYGPFLPGNIEIFFKAAFYGTPQKGTRNFGNPSAYKNLYLNLKPLTLHIPLNWAQIKLP